MNNTYAKKEEERLLDTGIEKVLEISIERLPPFANHPFKVKDDDIMKRLMESIKLYRMDKYLIQDSYIRFNKRKII